VTSSFPVERGTPLAPISSSAGTARVLVRSALSDWGLDRLEPDACLLATELVTNGLVHGGGPLSITVEVHNDRLRIAVGDSEPPQTPSPASRGTTVQGSRSLGLAHRGDRGLVLVEALADTWGVTRTRSPHGKVVWCELDLSQHQVGPSRPCGGEPS
jgi:anti-sigma regulatory factor (Ser/Thr protein kinase)